MSHVSSRTFTARVDVDSRGRKSIALPFDPSEAWGVKARHHVTGTVGEHRIRGPLTGVGTDARFVMGRASSLNASLANGDVVQVVLSPEGPQLATLPPDVAAALAANAAAEAFFASLATFYRKGYLRWVDATKRRPEVRAARISEMVELLAAGRKERPAPGGR